MHAAPTAVEAEQILKQAELMNPGPWANHSRYVGMAARNIAQACGNLDPEIAHSLGLLHDIGRRAGVTNMRHSIDGYRFCMDSGYHAAAKICLTHSFPYKDIREAFGEWDCSAEEYSFVADYIHQVEYDSYDLLIQLCDALALPSGFSLLEKRMIDVALRHGVHDYTVVKWKRTFEIKLHFESIIGSSIYDALPGVVENTFAFHSSDLADINRCYPDRINA